MSPVGWGMEVVMQEVEIKLVGVLPMLMHNARLSDPLNEYTKRLKALTSKRKKTDADHSEIARVEWEGGLYYTDEDGVHIPAANLMANIIEGAKLDKNGKAITRGVSIAGDKFKVKSKGMPRTLDAMFDNPKYVDRRSVRNQQNRVIRTRPRIPEGWEIEFKIESDENVLGLDELVAAIVKAGMYSGLGDFRQQFGRFKAFVKRGYEYVDAQDFVDSQRGGQC